jgi:type III restriction enzyme
MRLDYRKDFERVVNIILSEENKLHFTNVIDASKEEYGKETLKRDGKLKTIGWEIPETLAFGGNHTLTDYKLSVMQPFYYDNRWKTEKAFIKFLESQANNIEWWFKNGDGDATYFAVEYEDFGEIKPFYPDFIVKLKDGSVGIFDTKSGRTIKDAKEKSDGLQKYIKKQNAKGKKLFGGIVANTNSNDFTGRWMVYTNKGLELNPEDFSNWELLEFEKGS